MAKYQNWLQKNTFKLTGKTILLIGGTGSIGKAILNYLTDLDLNIILAARNLNKAKLISDRLKNIQIIELDIASLRSIDNFIEQVKQFSFDYVINNSGVYNLANTTSPDSYEIHFATNALGNYYLLKQLIKIGKKPTKYLLTSSISYCFNKLDFEDFEGINYQNSIKRYGLTKQIMMLNSLKLKNDGYDIILCQPGICATELFTKNKSKFMKYLCYPLMKVIFHNEKKAALAIIKGLFTDTKLDEWIGPCVLGIWGYPKISKIKRQYLDNELIKKCNLYTEKYLENKE